MIQDAENCSTIIMGQERACEKEVINCVGRYNLRQTNDWYLVRKRENKASHMSRWRGRTRRYGRVHLKNKAAFGSRICVK